jgi:hypothetical protein
VQWLREPLHGWNQRWASFSPEVMVKSLPLTTNLKIVRVTSFSLPAWKTFETVTSFSLPAPKKFETVKSLFSQLSLKKVTVIRCRYSTELKKETVKLFPLLSILKNITVTSLSLLRFKNVVVFEVILHWFKRTLADTCNGYSFWFFLLKIKRNGSSLFSLLICINCNGYIVSFLLSTPKWNG